jgi:DNA-binding response OmpR family regulator
MKKIFLRSHDQDWLFLINKSLEQAGYEVHFIEEGTALEKTSADLYILDTMSTEDLSTCHDLKYHPDATPVPVFITSGDYSIKNKALNSGADAFLKKPFHTQNLLSLIAKLR